MVHSQRESILYVDDDVDSRLAFGWLFRNAGFDVLEAATGTEALQLARNKPDLVVLDVNLPDINGFDICRQIKAHPATSSIPVLHLSAYFVSSEDRAHGLDGGADGYLTKPIEPDELLAQVKARMRVRRAEEEARAAARQWQAMVDALGDGVCQVDGDGSIVRCNEAMARLLGKPFADVIGQPYRSLVQTALGFSGLSFFARARELSGREALEVRVGERWHRVTADPVHDENGVVIGSIYLHLDITERKRLEEQLREAQKLEAIGRLAGGVAHEFNNLLTTITGNASVLLGALSTNDPSRESLTMIESAAWRAAELTRRLLGFSRQTLLCLGPIDLNVCVRETVDRLRRTIDPRVLLETRTSSDLALVQADSTSIAEVLVHLCSNACDAMPGGGRLVVETDNVTIGAAEAAGRPAARPGLFVRLRVRDTGTGIAPDLLPHIFEPFFTTKELGKGTGLGLAMAFGIVKQHGGWIECASAVNQGTRFDIYLPRGEPASPT
jgi:PAS domain S-box-containing protein